MAQTRYDFDVAIVGGGPAGLTTAIACREKGMSVLVVDSARRPIDKPCGEGLMPDGLAALARLGISVDAALGHPFRGIRFVAGAACVEADFPDGAAIGIRRTKLHELLWERAAAAGARFAWGVTSTGISSNALRIGDASVSCRWIAGADGLHSRVRRWAGLESFTRDRRRFGFRAHYRVRPWSDCMEIHWGRDCQAYVTPISDGEVCVAVISSDPRLRLADALARIRSVGRRLAGAERSSAERGALTSTRRLARVYRGNVALVGDASGSVDAITGEGLCLSFRQAVALAAALAEGDLAQYAAEHRRLLRRPSLMADLMLILGQRPRVRERAVRALAAKPRVFEAMLAMHVGSAAPLAFASSAVVLAWNILMV